MPMMSGMVVMSVMMMATKTHAVSFRNMVYTRVTALMSNAGLS